jgi:hypothetical protein
MKFEKTWVGNFEGAFRGLRNPKESWDRSDSFFGLADFDCYADIDIAEKWMKEYHPEIKIKSDEYDVLLDKYAYKLAENRTLDQDDGLSKVAYIGPNDMKLAQTLIKSGPEHRKFLRQIFVSVDISAPLYWWKEMDTYKVATVANSTSTMHKLTSKPITLDCFETDDMNSNLIYYSIPGCVGGPAENDIGMLSDFMIEQLEFLRQKYLETKDKRYWKELVRWLPESWLQTRTWTANYETIRAICSQGQRRNHKLNEWGGKDDPSKPNFISWARSLPYAQYLIFDDEKIPFQIEK